MSIGVLPLEHRFAYPRHAPGLQPSPSMDPHFIPDFVQDDDSFDLKDEALDFDEADFDEAIKSEQYGTSPNSNAGGQPYHNGSASAKRPTRKSTLTQQQKNQKRQRATQDQLATLEVEFNKNPTPNAAVRERIAQQINMTERSVQIWFQNRRAKIKNLAKRSIENGEECDAIPDSMRRYLHMQAMESGNPDYLLERGGAPFGNGLVVNADSHASKVMIYHLNCRSLIIGSWRRVGQTQLDLVIFYSPAKSMMTYYIQAENTGFRIEYPFSSIKSIVLEDCETKAESESSSFDPGHIVVELLKPPIFTMDQGSNGWFTCRDFTQDQQASKVLTHRLGGHPKILGNQLSKLTSLDAFRNRFSPEQPKVTVLSPMPILMEARPSSQPNHMVHPHSGVFHDPTFHMGPPPPRGHKRQRSRSVPAILDFGPRRQPVPPFLVQHHHIHHHNTVHNIQNSQNQIFAPIPQYPTPAPYAPPNSYGSVAPPLQIDPSSGFNFDFNTPAPPSATTGTTPPSSDFENSLYPPPPFQYEAYSAPQPQGPFASGNFLSPIADSPQGDTNSPLPMSHLSPNDLSPHNPLFRSASADPRFQHMQPQDQFYGEYSPFTPFATNGKVNGFDEHKFDTSFVDEGNWPLTDNVDTSSLQPPVLDLTKQQISLPYRTSMPEPPQAQLPPGTPPSVDDYEFSELVNMTP